MVERMGLEKQTKEVINTEPPCQLCDFTVPDCSHWKSGMALPTTPHDTQLQSF